jgi:nuclear pore complex protein Nup210
VKGVGIGHEAVSAQLFEPQFEHVNDTITLTVAEAMSLEPPSPVLVTLGVSVNFKLKIFRQKVARGNMLNFVCTRYLLTCMWIVYLNQFHSDQKVNCSYVVY